MKIKTTISGLLIAAALLAGSLLLSACGSGSGGSAHTIDHTTLNAADIPLTVLDDIRTLDVYFEHASVGSNIMSGLDTLASDPSARYTFTHGGSWGNDTSSIGTDIPAWFVDNNGFGDNARGNPSFAEKLTRFDSRLRDGSFASSIDVAMFKFCYIDEDYLGVPQDSFDSVCDVMKALQRDYTSTTFVWFTMPIETQLDAAASVSERTTAAHRATYNQLVRDYCAANNQWLFDIADIESHDASGTLRTDTNGDERMVTAWSYDGGHLTAAGEDRVARAWWVLLAKIQGW